MIRVGQILITIGFLISALSTAMDPIDVNWALFTPGAVLGVVGIVVAIMGRREYSRSIERLTTNLSAIGESLTELAESAQKMDAEKKDIFVYDVHERIDEAFPKPLDRFVQARVSVIHAFGMNDYANLMNHFAAGERAINRAWSASVDGYVEEVHKSITKSALHFKDAKAFYGSLQRE
jgi:hypothetical protein